MFSRVGALAFGAALFSACSILPAYASPTYVEVDGYPPDQFGQSGRTFLEGIDSQGNVVGSASTPSSGSEHGFIRLKNGRIRFAKTHHATGLSGMNNHGAAVGDMQYFHKGQWANKAIIVGFDKTVTGFKVPGAGVYAGGVGINDDGVIVGLYEGTDLNIHGFLRDAEGVVSSFDAPGAGDKGNEATGTYPTAINASGWVVGYIWDNSNVRRGFVRDPSGNYSAVDLNQTHSTYVNAINADGVAAGDFGDGTAGHGFVRSADGTVTDFDAIKGAQYTASNAINGKGVVAGYALDSAGVSHGFVRSTSGKVAVFDVPDLGFGPPVALFVNAINDKGQIAGYYTDSSNSTHGFIRLP